MSSDLDCVVIGAGVVGLAVARALVRCGREVVLIDRRRDFGMETSSRNSEVIHAGIYYPENSLKAFHCVRGNSMLYDYCQSRNVPYSRIGKLIVAGNDREVATLEAYVTGARNNGVADIRRLTGAELTALEPNLDAVGGLYSPQTGIVDSHALMTSLLADFERQGGVFVKRTEFISAKLVDRGIACQFRNEEISEVTARVVINSAGLLATDVASNIVNTPSACIPTTEFAIGHYYALSGKSPFKHLIYPVAEGGGLGVHATMDLSGATRFGPDIRWIDSIDYKFQDNRRSEFVASIRRYYPAIRESLLVPGYTGIRPKIGGHAKPNVDFSIQTEREHSVRGLINLFGIESPGLTASLSLAESISETVQGFD